VASEYAANEKKDRKFTSSADKSI